MTPNGVARSPEAAPAAGVGWGRVFWYALPAAPITFQYNFVLIMFAAFATDVLGVAPAALGAVFVLSKGWDAVSDPAAGYLSDRTRSRFGRRKTWIAGSVAPFAVFSLMAWAPPESLAGGALTVWVAVAVFGFFTAYTLFEVPHMSLGAELSQQSAGRNRVFGGRQLLKVLGMLACAGIGVQALEDLGAARENARRIAWAVGAAYALTAAVALWRLPAERADYRGRGAQSPFRALRDVWGNRYARLVLFVYFIESLGAGGVGVLVPYVIRYIQKEPHLIAEMLFVVYGVSILAVPFWVRLARRWEKRRLWLVAMFVGCAGFGTTLLLDEGRSWVLVVSSTLVGLATTCGSTLGQAIKADIIDYDEYLTGERKEGSYFAVWQFVNKLAGALMVGVVLIMLDFFGYRPGEEQSEATKAGMLFLLGGMPLIGYALGIAVFLRFDFGDAQHARVVAELEKRRPPA